MLIKSIACYIDAKECHVRWMSKASLYDAMRMRCLYTELFV